MGLTWLSAAAAGTRGIRSGPRQQQVELDTGPRASAGCSGSWSGFFGIFPGIVAYMVWLERKVAARFQDRIGPNRVGPLGLLQPIADAIKLITKENIVPRTADQLGPPGRRRCW